MEIHSEARIHYPRAQVFEAYRDQLPGIVEFIPDISEVIELKREVLDGEVVKLHNEWAGQTEIPRAARAVLKPEHLRWDDYAEWHATEWLCHWEIKTRVFKNGVSCKGKNTFYEEGGSTRVLLTGDLLIDLKTVPGVPGFVGRRLAPKLEKFIVSLITPNLLQVNTAIEQYLDAQQAR